MRCSAWCLASSLTLGALIVSPVAAEEITFSADLSLGDSYIWRGQVLSDRNVFQPSLSAEYGRISANVWGNMNLDSGNGQSVEFNEVDYTLSYAVPTDTLAAELGLIEYSFPNTSVDSTREVYFTVAPNDWPLDTALSVYYDFGEVEGIYATAAIGRDIEANKFTTVNLGASAGWGSEDYNSAYFGVVDPSLNDGNVSASATFNVADILELTTGVQHTWMLDNDIETSAGALYNDDSGTRFFFGVAYDFQ